MWWRICAPCRRASNKRRPWWPQGLLQVATLGALCWLSVLLGKGDGQFAEAIAVPVGRFPHYRAFGDWNGDGHVDVAIVAAGDDAVNVLLGDGTGNLQRTGSYTVGTNPHGLDVGDFNGDGRLDLIVSNRSSRDLHILLGDGTGAFVVQALLPM